MLVRDLIEQHKHNFTAAERRIIPFLRDDTIAIEFKSITKLAEAAEVSAPTIIRLARKIGFDGFPKLQRALRLELAEKIKQPLAKMKTNTSSSHKSHIIHRFVNQITHNINQTIAQLDYAVFDATTTLLSNRTKNLYFIGGRITRSNAHYFFNHLQIIRPNTQLMDLSRSVWPQIVLGMNKSSVLVVFDIRRYEKELETLAGFAASRGAFIVLFTDQWGSPIERIADTCFRALVEAPSSWDSTIAINLLIESMLPVVQQKSATFSANRIQKLEEMIGETGIFRELPAMEKE